MYKKKKIIAEDYSISKNIIISSLGSAGACNLKYKIPLLKKLK